MWVKRFGMIGKREWIVELGGRGQSEESDVKPKAMGKKRATF